MNVRSRGLPLAAALQRESAVDDLPHPQLGELVRVAALLCEAPIAFIGLLDEEPRRITVPASVGAKLEGEAGQTPFFDRLLQTGQALVVPDALADDELRAHRLVRDEPGLRAVAGAPLVIAGHTVGLVAVADVRARGFTSAQVMALEAMARQVALLVEHQRAETARREAEQRLQDEARLHTAMLDCASYGILILSPEGVVRTMNRAACEWLGYLPEEVEGRISIDAIHNPWELAVYAETLARRLGSRLPSEIDALLYAPREGIPQEREWTWLGRAGRHVPVLLNLTALHDAHGKLEGILAMARDITVRKALDAERRHLASIVESSDDAVLSIDFEGRIHTWNRGAERLFGFTAAELIGEPAAVLCPEGELDDVAPYLDALAAGRSVPRLETRRRRKDGAVVDVALQPSPIFDGDGDVVGASLHMRDMTERRRMRVERERLAAVIDATPDMVALLDGKGRPVYANAAMRRVAGFPDGLPERWHDVHPPWAQRVLLEQAVPEVLKTGTWSGETAYLDTAGREIPVLHVLIGHRGDDGEVAFISSVARDISERKQVEQMKQEFVSTVSHELRTPLTSIRGSLGLVLGADLDERQRRSLLDMAARNCDRLTALVNDLLDTERLVAGRVELKRRIADVSAVVRDSVDALAPLASGQQVQCTVDVDGSNLVFLDPERIGQVLGNLLSNAIKFSPAGSVVEVRVRSKANRVRVEVRDYGPGVPDAFRGRLFERFSQADGSITRRKGGTGLGLAISKALVELHDGGIGHEAPPGGGAVFWFELPTQPIP